MNLYLFQNEIVKSVIYACIGMRTRSYKYIWKTEQANHVERCDTATKEAFLAMGAYISRGIV